MEQCDPEQRRGVKIKSNSQYLVWPPAALSTAVHLLLRDPAPDLPVLAVRCYPTLPPRPLQVPRHFWGVWLSPHPPIQQVQDVLNGIEIRGLRWPWQNTDIHVLQEITHRTSSMAGGIVMLEGHDEPAGRVPHEGGGCLPCNAQL